MTVRHGSASIQQQGNRTTIVTGNGPGSRHSALDWRSFQVPGGQSVYFAQPDASSTSINRVTGGNPSAILGTLGSNGRLVLVNPAGIAVGAGAVVDTAGFTASTLEMRTGDAVAGRLRFGGTGADGGALDVQGRVLARGGDIVLVAPRVDTGAQALVQAVNGDVVLAAGRQVEITGRGIEGIHLQVKAPRDRAVNLGKLAGDSVAMFAGQLRHSGQVEAIGSTVSGGRVVLHAGTSADIDGGIRATTPSQGGSVHLTAEALMLKSAANVDVRHAGGGGEILVGGGWQGQDARIANARTVDVAEGAQLRADATLAGNGGTVVAWSDGTTRFHGALSAR
ncbi:MAG: filamentous hemagglutinin N-terminal domain-containing protein, partial [Comamonadaceae bacterium]